ncbi:DUF397 domain-containing protein [Streptomyces sp. SCA3-4]|uniref:DUF397 domain-containing protein n=1 Tax=Streptomyces sichuanensis TaxID=2871810 RepID=UPI001CE2AC2F|nr:DUF397 domain-containing protein [Streptomyces sichuanensis]MCA6094717.1 DUF397 domain-containing protein [Streptomyces sichuanensis]
MSTDWIRSSHSGGAGGDCVEVRSGPREIRVRDSKRITGPELAFPASAWATFVAALGGGG